MDKIKITLPVRGKEFDEAVKRMKKSMDKAVGSFSQVGSAAMGAVLVNMQGPLGDYARSQIQNAVTWEYRQYYWEARYGPTGNDEYQRCFELYADFSGTLLATDRNPVETSWHQGISDAHWRTIKETLEVSLSKKLINIKPSDAIELAKTTSFSAEQWYKGCTDRKDWK